MKDANYGVVITEECLRLGQKIRFKLDQLDRNYRGSFGLVRVLLILLNCFFENGSKMCHCDSSEPDIWLFTLYVKHEVEIMLG